MTREEAMVESSRWVKRVLLAHNVKVVTFAENDLGLLNVPAKYCAVITDMHEAIVRLMSGEPLPDLKK